MMSDNNKKTEIDFENKRAQIIYTTDKGKVKVSFEQGNLSESDPEVSREIIELVARVSSKSKFKIFYEEIASASEEVYRDWCDTRSNSSNTIGTPDFSYNMENVTLKHDNPEIEKIIQQAQKDIAKRIPEEKQRLQHLEEQKNQEENNMNAQEISEKRKKENEFTKKYLDLIVNKRD